MAQTSEAFSVLKYIAIGLAVTMSLATPAQAKSGLHKKLVIGNWKGGVYYDKSTGFFTHCSLRTRYKSRITLGYSINDQLGLSLLIAKASWKFNPGATMTASYQVDRHPSISGTATAQTKHRLQIDASSNPSFINHLRRGRELKVQLGQDLLRFDLRSSTSILKSVHTCARQNKGLRVD